MVMILIHHCIAHGLGLTAFEPEFHSTLLIPDSWLPAAMISNSFCICAVNCFVLISGYFGIRTSGKKIWYLVFALLFYTVLFAILPAIFRHEYRSALRFSLFLSHSTYWFVIDYIFLMAFTPMINLAFEKLSHKVNNRFVIALLIISCYFGFMFSHVANQNGYTLLQFILMYCIGRIIRRDNFSLSKIQSISGYVVCSLLAGLFTIAVWRFAPSYTWRTTYYNNPLIIAAAVFLMLFFKDLVIDSPKINSVAKSAFGIYLFGSAPLLMRIQKEYLGEVAHLKWGGVLIISVLAISLVVAVFALLFDRIRIYLYNVTEKLINKNQ